MNIFDILFMQINSFNFSCHDNFTLKLLSRWNMYRIFHYAESRAAGSVVMAPWLGSPVTLVAATYVQGPDQPLAHPYRTLQLGNLWRVYYPAKIAFFVCGWRLILKAYYIFISGYFPLLYMWNHECTYFLMKNVKIPCTGRCMHILPLDMFITKWSSVLLTSCVCKL